MNKQRSICVSIKLSVCTYVCVRVFSGTAETNTKEAQRLLHGVRVAANDEGGVFEHQRSQERDGEAGGAGGMAVAHRGMGGMYNISPKLHRSHSDVSVFYK